MKFIVTNSKKDAIASLESVNQTIMFLVTYKRRGNQDLCTVLLQGSDLDKQTDYKWIERKIESDEVFKLEVLSSEKNNDSENSTPILKTTDRQEKLDKNMLEAYHKLKKDLEEKGLI